MAIRDYVLTEDVNADRSLFFFFSISHYLEVTSILLKHKKIPFF